MMLYHRGYIPNGEIGGRLIGHPGAVFGLILTILVIAALVVLIVLMVKNRKPKTKASDNPSQSGTKAAEILDVKFAQGEIDEEEYLKRKRVLTENS